MPALTRFLRNFAGSLITKFRQTHASFVEHTLAIMSSGNQCRMWRLSWNGYIQHAWVVWFKKLKHEMPYVCCICIHSMIMLCLNQLLEIHCFVTNGWPVDRYAYDIDVYNQRLNYM